MESIFWSSSDEDDENFIVDKRGDTKEEEKIFERVEKRLKVSDAENEDKTTSIHRLSTLDKAGLSGNQEKIEAVLANQKESLHSMNQQKKLEKIDEKVQSLQRTIAEIEREEKKTGDILVKARIASVEKEVKRIVDELECMRVVSCTFAHIDMDSFFVSVELLDRPDLLGKPVAVGGPSMLSTSSYEARKFGVRSAMPGFLAMQLCPELIILKPNFSKYQAIGSVIREIFADYDPYFRSMSLDEASLDLTACCQTRGAEEVAKEIQKRVLDATKCTCSIGLACNRSLSKIASNMKKPNGIFRLPGERDEVVRFMSSLPIRKVSGVGPVTEAVLKGVGLSLCGDLFEKRHLLARIFKPDTVRWYLDVALGFPSSSVEEDKKKEKEMRKSISTERTIGAEGLDGVSNAVAFTRELLLRLCEDMEEEKISGKTLTLKMKSVAFDVYSRSQTLAIYTRSFKFIWEWLQSMVEEEIRKIGAVRLIGVRMSNLKKDKDAV